MYPIRAAEAFPALKLKTPIFGMEPTARMFNNGDFTHRGSVLTLCRSITPFCFSRH